MIQKCLELLRSSKESDQTIARNNGLKTSEVRMYRLGKKEPTSEIAANLSHYFINGGDLIAREQKNPLKELRRQNRAFAFYFSSNNLDDKIEQEKLLNEVYRKRLELRGVSLQDVGL